MPGGGSNIFADSDGYQLNIQDIIDLLVLRPRDFHARLTWADLPNLELLRARESSARVGFMTLPSDQVFVTFPTRRGSTLVYGSNVMEFGELMLHSRGERLHQRTTAACEWASIAITPAALSTFSGALVGKMLVAPAAGQLLRPRQADGRRLERLHARVCQLVERNLDSVTNSEVVRALEQDLIGALVSCLANAKPQKDRRHQETRPEILPALEAVLAKEPHKLLRTREICGLLGVSEATLRAKCLLALGMGPGRYQRIRRLKLIRAELLRAKSNSEPAVEETVTRYGFPNLHRFITEYWRAYGEMPPIRPLDPISK